MVSHGQDELNFYDTYDILNYVFWYSQRMFLRRYCDIRYVLDLLSNINRNNVTAAIILNEVRISHKELIIMCIALTYKCTI